MLPNRVVAGEAEKGFVALFNGKDLTGWVRENKGKFSVKEGVIVLDRGSGWLRSEKEYQDFELRLEFRFISKGADSGIFLRASKDGSNWPAQNYQVQTMDNESIAGLFAMTHDRPKVKRDAARMRQARKPVGQWQEYVITLQGDHAEIKLNGEVITVGTGLTVQPGYIGLQGEDGQLEFKNIRIRAMK
jgi:hypothetical protein